MVLNKRQSFLVYKILRQSGYGNGYNEFNNGHIVDAHTLTDYDQDDLISLTESLAVELDVNTKLISLITEPKLKS
jgi:hypothetical protein